MVDSSKGTHATPSPLTEEFQAKQIHLAKRDDGRRPASAPQPPDEFQCRPIRLGSRNRPLSTAVLPLHRASASDSLAEGSMRGEALPTPSRQSPRLRKHSSFNLLAEAIDTERSDASSATLTTDAQAAAPAATPIQIKSLPIERRRHSSASHSRGDSVVEGSYPDPNLSAPVCTDKIFAVCLVNFHHLRGPEVQYWRLNYHPQYNPALFRNLPFQALPDGSHLFEETFSNFNLCYDFATGESLDDDADYNTYSLEVHNMKSLKTLFGCLCVQQVRTELLLAEERERNSDITRSIVQKAVVVICRGQPIFNKIKDKLSIITGCYFQQGDFADFEILDLLFDLLNDRQEPAIEAPLRPGAPTLRHSLLRASIEPRNDPERQIEREEEFFVNLDLKGSVLKFGPKFLIIFKCLVLERKCMVYSTSNLELLTQFQNTLVLLMPNLIAHLDLAGCPLLDYTEIHGPLRKPVSLNTNSRHLMLRFFGLPLQIFNTKGSFWNSYLPLQQLNELSSDQTRSYMIGCSNLLFVNQLELLGVDVLVNLDLADITFPATKGTRPDNLTLLFHDKRFINNLVAEVRQRHQNHQQQLLEGANTASAAAAEESYIGSDDYIRYQFEDYLLSLLSTTRYNQYVEKFGAPPPGFSAEQPTASAPIDEDSWSSHLDVETNNVHNGDLTLFNKKFVESWTKTANFKIWNATADDFVFNFLDPKHLALSQNRAQGEEAYFSNLFSGFKRLTTGAGADATDMPATPKAHKYIPNEARIVSVINRLPQRIVPVKLKSDEQIVPVTLQGLENIVPVKLGPDSEDKTFGKKFSSWAGAWYKKK